MTFHPAYIPSRVPSGSLPPSATVPRMTVVYLLLVLAAGMGLWGLISPMSLWRGTVAWRYADPEAHRPSESQNIATRIACLIALICIGIAFPLISSLSTQGEEQQEEESYQDCLDEHDDDEGLLTPEDWCEDLSPGPEES